MKLQEKRGDRASTVLWPRKKQNIRPWQYDTCQSDRVSLWHSTHKRALIFLLPKMLEIFSAMAPDEVFLYAR